MKYRFNASQVVEISRASSFAHAAKARKKLAKMTDVTLNVPIAYTRSFTLNIQDECEDDYVRKWALNSAAYAGLVQVKRCCALAVTQYYQNEY